MNMVEMWLIGRGTVTCSVISLGKGTDGLLGHLQQFLDIVSLQLHKQITKTKHLL